MGAAGSLGFGIAGINFFGAKSKGEKIVFIIDAQKAIMEPHKGGYFTFQYAKDRLGKMIDRMSSATLFNVMAYDRDEAVMFRSKLVPANPAKRAALKKWIAPLNADTDNLTNLDDLPRRYDAPMDYDHDRIKTPYSWIRPIQAAMEQKADNIFVLCSGYGHQQADTDALLEMYGVESEAELLLAQGWSVERLANIKRHNNKLIEDAKKLVAEKNKEHRAEGEPPIIIQNWSSYVASVLDWDWLQRPSLQTKDYPFGVDGEWIIDYLEAVYEYNYLPQKLKKPVVHMVKLISADGGPIDDYGGNGNRYTFHYTQLKKIPKAFKEEMELLRGADSIDDLLRNNKNLDEE